MQQFAEQCIDMARSMLAHNLNAINEDGTITPIEGESSRIDEPGHAALAIGEYYRATGESELDGKKWGGGPSGIVLKEIEAWTVSVQSETTYDWVSCR